MPFLGREERRREGSEAFGIDRQMLTAAEAPVEHAVSRYIEVMPVLWLDIHDEPGADSLRGFHRTKDHRAAQQS